MGNGAKYYGNRDYTIKTFPDEFKGWALLQTNIKNNTPFVVTFSEPTTVLTVFSTRDGGSEGLPLADFSEAKGATISTSDGNVGNMLVYKKVCSGKVTFPPATSYFIIIESKP